MAILNSNCDYSNSLAKLEKIAPLIHTPSKKIRQDYSYYQAIIKNNPAIGGSLGLTEEEINSF